MCMTKEEILMALNAAHKTQSIYVIIKDSGYGVRVLMGNEIKKYKWMINGFTPETALECRVKEIWYGNNILDLTGNIKRMQK